MLKKYDTEKEAKKIIEGVIAEFNKNITEGNETNNEFMTNILKSDVPLTIKDCSKVLQIKQKNTETLEQFTDRIIKSLDMIIANNFSECFETKLSLIIRTRIELLMPDAKKLACYDKEGISKLLRLLSYRNDIINKGLEKRQHKKTLNNTQTKQFDAFVARYTELKSTFDLIICSDADLAKISNCCNDNLMETLCELLSNDYKKVIRSLLGIYNLNTLKELIDRYALDSDKLWNGIVQNIETSMDKLSIAINEIDNISFELISDFRIKCKIIGEVLSINSICAKKIVSYMSVSNNFISKKIDGELKKKIFKLKRERFKQMKMPDDENEIIKQFISSKQGLEEFVLNNEELNLTVSDLQVLILHYEALYGSTKTSKQTNGFNFFKYLYCDNKSEIEFYLCQNEAQIFEIMADFSQNSLNGTSMEYGSVYDDSNLKIYTPDGELISFKTIISYFKKYYPISYANICEKKNEIKEKEKLEEKMNFLAHLSTEELDILNQFPNFLGNMQAFQTHFNLTNEKMEELLEYAYYYKPELFKQLYSEMKIYEEDSFAEYMILVMELAEMLEDVSFGDEQQYLLVLAKYEKMTIIKIEDLYNFIKTLKIKHQQFYEDNAIILYSVYRFCTHWLDRYSRLRTAACPFDEQKYLEISHNFGNSVITSDILNRVIHILKSYEIPLLNIFVKDAIEQYVLDLNNELSFEEGNLKRYIDSLSFEKEKGKEKVKA